MGLRGGGTKKKENRKEKKRKEKKRNQGTVVLSDIRTGHYPNASQRHVRQLDRFVSPRSAHGCAVDGLHFIIFMLFLSSVWTGDSSY